MLGVFDSGVGGLSCIKAIKYVLPKEQIIYYGDTARAPYGSRPVSEIIQFATETADFLVGKGAKALAVACNTISCVALPSIQAKYPNIPVIGIVEPAGEEIARMYKGKKVGIIATEATIKSGAYPAAIEKFGGGVSVFTKATPDFVPYIESGHTSEDEFDPIVRRNLDGFVNDNKLDVIVLGCTHYPFIEENIRRCYPGLSVFNPSSALARKAATLLRGKESKTGPDEYYSSSKSEAFDRIVAMVTK